MLTKYTSLPSLNVCNYQKSDNLNERVPDLRLQTINVEVESEKKICQYDGSRRTIIENKDHSKEIKKLNRGISSPYSQLVSKISQSDTDLTKIIKTSEKTPCQYIFNQTYLENVEIHNFENCTNSTSNIRTDIPCRHVSVELGCSDVGNSSAKIEETKVEENDRRETSITAGHEKRFSCVSDISIDPHCRICHCGNEEEQLISPCSCAGSLQYIHESCLAQWMKSTIIDTCELCQEKIEIRRRLKPLWRWQRPSQRPYPLIWFLTFVAAIVLNVISVAKDASSHCTSTPCVIFFTVGCIGAVLSTIFMIKFAKQALDFFRQWMRINEDWIILDRKSTQTSKRTPRNSYYEERTQLLILTDDLTTRV